MGPRETSAAINEAAAAWAARADRGLSSEEEATLDAWLAADARRAGAFARAQAIVAFSEKAQGLGPDYQPASKGRAVPSRRRLFAWTGGAVAAGLAGIAVVGPLLRARADATTARGEVRRVPLADGSTITLNTASKVAVDYTKLRRGVRLLEGEAFFEVAKNPDRPFVVEAGELLVRAVGTSFVVRVLPDRPVEVLVREGRVQVTRRSDAAALAVALHANERAVAATDAGAVAVASVIEPAAVEKQLAWREGKIALEGVTLRQAAQEFARYSDKPLVISDATLGQETVTGLFNANDPAGFAEAVALSFGASVRRGVNGEVVLSR